MKINLSPQVCDTTLTVAVYGDVLHISVDGDTTQVFDFTPLPEGGILPNGAVACEYVVGDTTRVAGEIQLMLLLPITWNAPLSCTFPEQVITTGDGVVSLPTDEEYP